MIYGTGGRRKTGSVVAKSAQSKGRSSGDDSLSNVERCDKVSIQGLIERTIRAIAKSVSNYIRQDTGLARRGHRLLDDGGPLARRPGESAPSIAGEESNDLDLRRSRYDGRLQQGRHLRRDSSLAHPGEHHLERISSVYVWKR